MVQNERHWVPNEAMAKRSVAKSGRAQSPSSGISDSIPDKLYFRIGEVAELCNVETYVLRFWQTEFPQLAPKKSGTGQRLYRKRDVEQALHIKRLLHDEGYTIAGARGVFAAEALEQRRNARTQPELALSTGPPPESPETRHAREQADRLHDRAQSRLARMRLELQELHSLLSRAPAHEKTAPAPAKVKTRTAQDDDLLF